MTISFSAMRTRGLPPGETCFALRDVEDTVPYARAFGVPHTVGRKPMAVGAPRIIAWLRAHHGFRHIQQ